MRKKNLVFTFLIGVCFITSPASAQWRFGPMVGLNFAKMTSPSTFGQDVSIRNVEGITSFRSGWLVEYSPGVKVGLQTGLCFTGLGADYKIFSANYGKFSEAVETRLYYVSIPLEIHYALKNTSSKLTAYGGLDMNFLVLGTTNEESDGDAYKLFDPTLKLGAQLVLAPGLGLRLDYGFGTSDVFKDIYSDFTNDPLKFKNKNRCLGVSVFWLFGGSGVI